MEQFERARLDSYFARIATAFAPTERPSAFLIAHLLRSTRPPAVRWIVDDQLRVLIEPLLPPGLGRRRAAAERQTG